MFSVTHMEMSLMVVFTVKFHMYRDHSDSDPIVDFIINKTGSIRIIYMMTVGVYESIFLAEFLPVQVLMGVIVGECLIRTNV